MKKNKLVALSLALITFSYSSVFAAPTRYPVICPPSLVCATASPTMDAEIRALLAGTAAAELRLRFQKPSQISVLPINLVGKKPSTAGSVNLVWVRTAAGKWEGHRLGSRTIAFLRHYCPAGRDCTVKPSTRLVGAPTKVRATYEFK